jgi:hypothetical protein
VIEEMIALAKQMRKANERRTALKLSDEELAFYDALKLTTALAICGNRVEVFCGGKGPAIRDIGSG